MWDGDQDFLGVPYPFEVAREYAHGLGLHSVQEWWDWAARADKDPRISPRPDWTYRKKWISYQDFLGCDPPEDVVMGSDDTVPDDGP